MLQKQYIASRSLLDIVVCHVMCIFVAIFRDNHCFWPFHLKPERLFRGILVFPSHKALFFVVSYISLR